MPLKADKRMINAAVMTDIPMTEMRVIKLITFFFRLAERYRFAM
jgi:hypothetical protein